MALCQQRIEESQRPDRPRRRGRPPNYLPSLVAAQSLHVQATHAVEHVDNTYQQAKECLKTISQAYHPYDLITGAAANIKSIVHDVGGAIDTLQRIVTDLDLGDSAKAAIEKGRRLLPSLEATLSFFFTFIYARVAELGLPAALEQVMHQQLIPALYLQNAAHKASKAEQRRAIRATSDLLLASLRRPGSPLEALGPEQLRQLEQVARECAQFFQRSSSSVEGRNGYLSLWHHQWHRIRHRRLRALGVIHNYHSRRHDGYTRAHIFFDVPHASLFDFLVDHLDLPARPARKRPAPPPQPLLAAA